MIVQAAVPPLPTVEAVVGAIWNRGFVIAAENQPLLPLPAADPLPPGWDYPGHFRKAAADHLARVGLRPTRAFIPPHHDEGDGGRRARADASARGAGESRPRGDHDRRQRAAADRAGRDADGHRDA